eukprot:m.65917 g.65917  ORF g.65917 m.65917 type:complete len:159 (+) comp8324_c0_seq2:1339-1815(+)
MYHVCLFLIKHLPRRRYHHANAAVCTRHTQCTHAEACTRFDLFDGYAPTKDNPTTITGRTQHFGGGYTRTRIQAVAHSQTVHAHATGLACGTMGTRTHACTAPPMPAMGNYGRRGGPPGREGGGGRPLGRPGGAPRALPERRGPPGAGAPPPPEYSST